MVRVDDIVAKLDLGELQSLDDLPGRLREVRRLHLEALANTHDVQVAPNLMKALRDTRLAEIAIAEEALRSLGEPLDEPEQLELS